MNIATDSAGRNPQSEEIFEGGWCHAPNGLFEHPYFNKEDRERPLSRREAVLWIAKHVRWTDNCTVRKGQGSWSLRYLAEAWRWTKNKVDRFLKQLEKLRIIRAETGTGSGTGSGTAQCVITYLFSTCYVAPKTNTGTEAGQKRDRSGTKTKEGNLDSESEPKGSCAKQAPHECRFGFPDAAEATATAEPTSRPSRAANPSPAPEEGPPAKSPDGYPDDFEAVWKAAPPRARERSGRPRAFAAWKKLSPDDRKRMASAIPLWKRDQYAKGMHLWIRDRLWESLLELAAEKAAPSSSRNWFERANA